MKYCDRVESEREYSPFKFKVPNERERIEAIGLAGESTLFKNMFLHELSRFYHPFPTPSSESQQNAKGKKKKNHWVLRNKEYGEMYNEFIRNKKYRPMTANKNTICLVNVLFEDSPVPSPNETHLQQEGQEEFNSTVKNTFNNNNTFKQVNSYDRTYLSKSTVIDNNNNNNYSNRQYNTARSVQLNYNVNDNDNANENTQEYNATKHRKSHTVTFTTSLHTVNKNNNNTNVEILQETQTEHRPKCKFIPSTNTHDEEFLKIAKQFIEAFFFEQKIETYTVTLNINSLSHIQDDKTDTVLSVEADSTLNKLKEYHRQLIAKNQCYCVVFYTSMPLFHNVNALRNDKYHRYTRVLQGEEYDQCYGFGSPAEGRMLISFAAFEKALPGRSEEGQGNQQELNEEQKKRKREREMTLKAISYKYYIQMLLRSIAVMYGIKTCIYFNCLLNGSFSLKEFEGHPMEMCPVCLRKIYAISIDYSGAGSISASSNKKRVNTNKCHLYKQDLKVTANPELLFKRFNMIAKLLSGFEQGNNNSNSNIKNSSVVQSKADMTMSNKFTSNIYASVRSHVEANAESVMKASNMNASENNNNGNNDNNQTDEEKDKEELHKQLLYVFQTEKEWFVQRTKSLRKIHKFQE